MLGVRDSCEFFLMIFQGCSTELLTKRLSHLNLSLNNVSLDHTRALGSRDPVSKDVTFYLFYPFFCFSFLRSLERGIITKDKGTDKALAITLTCLWKKSFSPTCFETQCIQSWVPYDLASFQFCQQNWFSLLWSIPENDVLIAPFVFENRL